MAERLDQTGATTLLVGLAEPIAEECSVTLARKNSKFQTAMSARWFRGHGKRLVGMMFLTGAGVQQRKQFIERAAANK